MVAARAQVPSLRRCAWHDANGTKGGRTPIRNCQHGVWGSRNRNWSRNRLGATVATSLRLARRQLFAGRENRGGSLLASSYWDFSDSNAPWLESASPRPSGTSRFGDQTVLSDAWNVVVRPYDVSQRVFNRQVASASSSRFGESSGHSFTTCPVLPSASIPTKKPHACNSALLETTTCVIAG